MPTYNKQIRNWFFTTTGDTKVNNFWTRFVGGGVSKPSEQSMANLTASVPFFKEIDSAASVDIGQALENKQGLVIVAADANAKSGSNTSLAATGGALVTKPSQLPTVEQIVNDFTVATVPADGVSIASQVVFDIVPDATNTTRNKYLVKLSTPFVKWLLKRVLPAGGTATQVLSKTTGTDFDYGWSTVAAASGGDTYRGTSISSNSITKGSKTFTVIPNTGTVAYSIGNRIRFTDSVSNLNYVEGIITSWNTGTGILILNVDNLGGSGTSLTNWNVNLGGNIPSSDASGVANLYVSDLGGDDDLGDGSIIKPFKSIVKGVQMVNSNGANNQTIIIFAGSYPNNINVVKNSANKYTLYCFPGVIITQTATPFYDSTIANASRVDIYGEPNIIYLPTITDYTFKVKQVCKLNIGKIDCKQVMYAETYIYDITGLSNANEITVIKIREAVFENSTPNTLPAVKFSGAVGGFNRNNAIDFSIYSLNFKSSVAIPTAIYYIEIANPYSLLINNSYVYHGGTVSLPGSGTYDSRIFNFTGATPPAEVSVANTSVRLGGGTAGTSQATIFALNTMNLDNNFFKNISVSLSNCRIFSGSVQPVIAEDIYVQGGVFSDATGGLVTLASSSLLVVSSRIYSLGSDIATIKN